MADKHRAAKMQTGLRIFARGVVLVILGLSIVAGSGCSSSGGAKTTASPSPTENRVSQTKNVLTGTLVVPANGSRDLTIDIDGTVQHNIRLVGWIHASGGSQSEIEVFIANDNDYQSWQQGRKVTPMYNSGRTTIADLDVRIPSTMGRYHLVFNNVFSSSLKYIQAQLDLQYYAPPPTPTPTP